MIPPQEKSMLVYPASALPFTGRLVVEVGPGRGDFLFHLAEANPGATIIGIEIKPRRVEKLISRTEKRGLQNIRLILADARAALPHFFAEGSVDEIHVNFPDPWPKRRHEKNRAVGDAFLNDCLRALRTGGEIHFITDEKAYAESVAKRFRAIPGFESCYDPAILTERPDAFPTFFAQKWIALGRTIHYQLYRRVSESHW